MAGREEVPFPRRLCLEGGGGAGPDFPSLHTPSPRPPHPDPGRTGQPQSTKTWEGKGDTGSEGVPACSSSHTGCKVTISEQSGVGVGGQQRALPRSKAGGMSTYKK